MALLIIVVLFINDEIYRNIIKYCVNYGVTKITNSQIVQENYREAYMNAKTLYIVSTTGANLISALSSEILPRMLMNGANIYVIVPNKYSQYLDDVNTIEHLNNELKNVERLNNEFDNVVYNLKRSIELAKVRKSDCTGKIFMVCAYSIIRQTITFIEEEDKCSGWFSITIPPKRTVDGTPTMEFESDSPNGGVASLLLSHINSIIKMTQQRGAFYNIEEYSFENGFFLEKQSATAYWEKKYKRQPDLVVIEGPLAGGHLGFSTEQLREYMQEKKKNFDEEVKRILDAVKEFAEKAQKYIPVALAGGISSREQAEHAFHLGVDAIQVATRFVTTEECDADIRYKRTYLQAQEEDIVITKSPVGMPGRAILNPFLKKIQNGEQIRPEKCHGCLKHCKPAEIPYCITDALIHAAKGEVDEALLFCGAEAWKAQKIQTVEEVIQELLGEE